MLIPRMLTSHPKEQPWWFAPHSQRNHWDSIVFPAFWWLLLFTHTYTLSPRHTLIDVHTYFTHSQTHTHACTHSHIHIHTLALSLQDSSEKWDQEGFQLQLNAVLKTILAYAHDLPQPQELRKYKWHTSPPFSAATWITLSSEQKPTHTQSSLKLFKNILWKMKLLSFPEFLPCPWNWNTSVNQQIFKY